MTGNPVTETRQQIYLSYALSDRSLAEKVAAILTQSGVAVIRFDQAAPTGVYSDSLRQTLRRSAAVVVVLSELAQRPDIPANLLFEIGAAVGAGKPIYVVVETMTHPLPFGAPDLQVIPLSRVQEIAHRLAAAA
jgi:hypothetical protein